MKIVGYRTENKVNGHFYYGVRTLRKENDPYLGSGLRLKKAVDRYGKGNFVRIDLLDFETFAEALEWERGIITEELINTPECYNLKPGGAGGGTPWTEERKEKHKEKKSYKKTQETIKKMSKAAILRFKTEPGTFLGKVHTEETKKNLSERRKGKPGYNKGKKLNLTENRRKELRKPKSQQVKNKISRSLCKLTEYQVKFLQEEFVDRYGERTKVCKQWGINLDQIARIIGRRNGNKSKV